MKKTIKGYRSYSEGVVTGREDVEYCPRCGRPIFYRNQVGEHLFYVHGDRSICRAFRDEK